MSSVQPFRSLSFRLCGLGLLASVAFAQTVAPRSEEAAVVLNPFVVSIKANEGYVSTSSAALGRITQQLENIPLKDYAQGKLLQLFHSYALIGGMPEVIADYVNQRDILGLSSVFNQLLNGYKNDVEKYAENNKQANVIRHILENGWAFSAQTITLGGFASSAYQARETGEALRTLSKAMLLALVYPTTSVLMPVISDLKKAPKLFWLDVGLVNYAAGIQREYILKKDLLDTWRGRAAEQIVAQEFTALHFEVGRKNNFWVRNKRGSTAEVDFVYVWNGIVFPVEVKSGHNAHLKSLHQFMLDANHDLAIRIWSGKYSVDIVQTLDGKSFKLINLPFYMIAALPHIIAKFFITDEKLIDNDK